MKEHSRTARLRAQASSSAIASSFDRPFLGAGAEEDLESFLAELVGLGCDGMDEDDDARNGLVVGADFSIGLNKEPIPG